MRIFGQEVEPRKPLTVGELRAWLNKLAEWDPEADRRLVHMLRMEGTDDDLGSAYATHVEVDAFDTIEESSDREPGTAIPVVSLMHWPSRDREVKS